MLTKQKTSKT